jgi:hypothetical protein
MEPAPSASGPGTTAPAPAPAERWPVARVRKFRQAAFVYLHVGLLYEFVVFVLWREGLLPAGRGAAPLWLALGAAITAFVFWGLWRWQNARLAQIIWLLHALRLPALIRGAFVPDPGTAVPPSLFIFALPIVLINLWMLARAGWDL